MSEHFNIDRLLKLVRGDLTQRYRFVLTVSAAIAALAIIHAILLATGLVDRSGIYWAMLGIMVFGWGPVAASHSFRELNSKTQNEAYLLLPASAFEKMLARLILVTVIFPLYAIVFVTLLAFVIAGLRFLFFGESGPLFVPVQAFDYRLMGLFLIHQSLYFLGAAWYRKHHFVKTVLTLATASIGLIVLFGVLIRLFFPEMASGGIDIDVSPEDLFGRYEEIMPLAMLKFAAVVGIPVFCSYVAWLRIKEAQVSHGV